MSNNWDMRRIRRLHDWYLKRMRDLLGEDAADMSAHPLAVRHLLHLLKDRRPQHILETGLGFTTLVLAQWAQEEGCRLVGIDHNKAWLEQTALLLRERGIEAPPLLLVEEFREKSQWEFDLVFVDHGPSWDARREDLHWLVELVSDAGCIVLDDWYPTPPECKKPRGWRYSVQAGRLLEGYGFQVDTIEETRPSSEDKALAVARRKP